MVYENKIINSNIGIQINTYDCEIYCNNISGCENSGLYLESALCNNIFENNISYNKKYGIYIKDSAQNIIYHNNFIDNSINAFCDGWAVYPWEDLNQWNLDYNKDGGGNYWSDYKGEDKNGDNVGDSPYIIPDKYVNPLTKDKDRYPLMKPSCRPNYKSYSMDILQVIVFDKLLEQFPILQKLLNLIK